MSAAGADPVGPPGAGAGRPMPLRASAGPLTGTYDTALLDLDGVVYVGPHAVASAPDALAAARASGMRLAFVTNNAARTPDAVAEHLSALGVPAQPRDVVTSAQAAARVVSALVGRGEAVLVVGGAGLRAALLELGLEPVASADLGPAAVVQGFAPEVGWELLTEGALAVARGLPWVASNLDRTIPVPRGTAPGNGTLVEVIAMATGRSPDAVAGKPELPLHRESIRRTGARRPLVVGDRLDTDIDGATRGGSDSLLVLTGVATAADVLLAPPGSRPTYLAPDLSGLLRGHPAVVPAGGGWRCGGWVAHVRGGELVLTGGEGAGSGGDGLDGLRAACAAAWTAERPPDPGPLAALRLGR